jgi:hypothetical protein
VEPWKRFQRIGNSLFLWRVGFLIGCLAAGLVVVFVFFAPAATLSFSDALEALSIAAIVVGFIVVLVITVIAAFVLLLLENFVIPIMYRFDLKAIEAWRALLPWLRSYGGYFILYGLVVLLVAIPAFLVYWVLCCCTCCIIAIPYIGTVILLPLWVSYRCFGPEFLAQFDSSFDLFNVVPATPVAAVEGDTEPDSD